MHGLLSSQICGINIIFIDPTVLVSNTKNLLVKWGMGFTVDQPENPLQPSLTHVKNRFYDLTKMQIGQGQQNRCHN